MANYKTLDAWKLSIELVKEVYGLTKNYPKEELYALTSQTKRSAVSIPSNIAEGIGRQYKKDTLQFLYISRGSVYELETQLIIAHELDILSQENFNNVTNNMIKTLSVLNGLINYIQQKMKI